jgi:hypothetical protein
MKIKPVKNPVYVLVAFVWLLLAFVSFQETTPKVFTLTEQEASELFVAIDIANNGLPTSQAPAASVTKSREIFDKVVKKFQTQYGEQVKADSIKNLQSKNKK